MNDHELLQIAVSEMKSEHLSRREFLRCCSMLGIGSLGVAYLAGCAAPVSPTAPPPATKAAPPPPTPTAPPAATSTSAAKPQPSAATRAMIMGQRMDAVSLDPHANDMGYSAWPQRACYESLVNYESTPDGDIRLVPMLAASWEASEDAKTFTFQLQKGVKFSDGSPFDGEAVKWNFDRLFGLKLGPQGRLSAAQFDHIDVLSEQSVRIVLKQPCAGLPHLLAKPLLVSPTAAKKNEVSGDLGQKWLFDHAVGTGPYLLESWNRGQQLTFVKNPNYWRGWAGNHLEKIVIKVVGEPATQRFMLETGDADLADGIAFDDLDALSKASGVVVQGKPTFAIDFLMLRQRGPLKNRLVRQALQYAFDYDAFVTGVFNKRAKVPRGPLPDGFWATDTTLPPYKRDAAKAKQLLVEAGYPNGGFSLVVWILPAYGWFQPRETQILQQNLKELGIALTIEEKTDTAVLMKALEELDKGPDIYAWGVSLSASEPDIMLRRLWYSPLTFPKGENGVFYNNARVDALIDQGVTISSQEKRMPIYKEVQKILIEDAVAICADQKDFFINRREALQDYPWHPFIVTNGPDWWKMWLSK